MVDSGEVRGCLHLNFTHTHTESKIKRLYVRMRRGVFMLGGWGGSNTEGER